MGCEFEKAEDVFWEDECEVEGFVEEGEDIGEEEGEECWVGC